MAEEKLPDLLRFHPAMVKTGNKVVDQPDLLHDTLPVKDAVKVDIAHNCLERIPDLVVQDLELLHVMLDLRRPLRFNLLFEPLMVGYIMVLNEDT